DTSVPYILYLPCLSNGINIFKSLLKIFISKIIPCVALKTLVLYKSTHVLDKMILSILNATALLIIVPKLTGYCISSKISILSPNLESVDTLQIPIILGGVSNLDIFFITLFDTIIVSTSIGTTVPSSNSKVFNKPLSLAQDIKFNPSTK